MYKLKRYSSAFCIFFILFSVKNVFAQKPIITSFSPTKGNIGSTVIISGSNFGATATNNVVYFGDVKANVLSATLTSLTAVVLRAWRSNAVAELTELRSITTNHLFQFIF